MERREPWMRGTHEELDGVRRAVVHALEQAGEDGERWAAGLTTEEVHRRPAGVASVAFHLRHAVRSLDRLLCYAEDRALDEGQLAALRTEMEAGESATGVMGEFRTGLARAVERVRAFGPEMYGEARGIGRARLPTTVVGLLIHCAEHTQRHAGQMVTTAKVVRGGWWAGVSAGSESVELQRAGCVAWSRGRRHMLHGKAAERGTPGQLAPLRSAVLLALGFAGMKLLVHVAANVLAERAGYGIFRDELYYIVCGRNLDWGYLDQPPMVAVQARVAETVFGLHSLALFRLLPSLAGAVAVGLTGLLAWRMGGGRAAQALGMLGVLCSPILMGVDGNLSMNAWEPMFWVAIALLLVEVVRRWGTDAPVAGLWVGIGALAGLGLENKWNIAFYLLAMFAGVLLSPQRGVLWSRWVLVGTAIGVAVALPNFVWEMHRGWPTLEWLHNDAVGNKNIQLGPVAFVANQVQVENPVGMVLWGAGWLWFLFGTGAKKYRSFGLMFLVYLPMMIAMHAKDYYLAPVFPILFAGGGVAWSLWLRGRWRVLIPAYAVVLVFMAAISLPLALPVLRPEQYVAYTKRLGRKTPETQTFDHAALPQYFADMRGWKEKADAMAGAYLALSPEDRAKAVIYTTNYGGASAVNVYRPDVPVAVSGHQNYWFWGPRGHTGEVMVIYGDGRKADEEEFASVTDVRWTPEPWTEPYEQKTIYVCKGPKGWTLPGLWPKVKEWY